MSIDIAHANDQHHLFKEVFPRHPELKGESILQCGARPGEGFKEIFEGFKHNGYGTFHVLEIWEPNFKWLQKQPEFPCEPVLGDIRLIDQYDKLDDQYDIITFWHGPEHLTQKEFHETIPKVMAKVRKAFIVGAPWGNWAQADIKGNPHEKHTYHWMPDEWEALGFEVYTFNDPRKGFGPHKHNVMVGIKYK